VLRQRVATALVVATLFLAALFGLAPAKFILIMALVVAFAAWEWSALAGLSAWVSRLTYVLVLSMVLAAAARWLTFDDNSLSEHHVRSLLGWACAWWAIALLWLQGYPSSAILWGRWWVCAAMGLVVLVPTWIALAVLVHAANGTWLVLSVVMIVALADIGAYFTGRAFGRRKLAEQVSPGKTWEGLGGGMCAVVLAAMLYAFYLAEERGEWWAWVLLAAMTGLASVIGDLLESMVKRHRGVKDSGFILPGHGGLLDRIDSITAAFPVFTLMYALLYEHLS
jgi:phosphatidate cytidylyltransferase